MGIGLADAVILPETVPFAALITDNHISRNIGGTQCSCHSHGVMAAIAVLCIEKEIVQTLRRRTGQRFGPQTILIITRCKMRQYEINKCAPRTNRSIFFLRPSRQARLTGNLQHIRHLGTIGIIKARPHHHLLAQYAGGGLFDKFSKTIEPRIVINARFKSHAQYGVPIGRLARMANAVTQFLFDTAKPFIKRECTDLAVAAWVAQPACPLHQPQYMHPPIQLFLRYRAFDKSAKGILAI